MTSIHEVIDFLRRRHEQFLEANYHLRNDDLILKRRRLIESGSAWSSAWIEATPAYDVGDSYGELGLPKSVAGFLDDLTSLDIGVYQRPFSHQSEALRRFFVEGKDSGGGNSADEETSSSS